MRVKKATIKMNVKRVGNVILAVKDLNRSIEFYNKIIGLPIKQNRDTWVDLGSHGTLLSLHPTVLVSSTEMSIDNGITIGFIVGDIKSALEELKGNNVKIYRDIIQKEAGKYALVLDPDNYIISLFEPNFVDKEQQTTGYMGFTPQ